MSGMRSISLCGSFGTGLSAPSVVFAVLAPPADLMCGLSKDHNWVRWRRWAVSAQGKELPELFYFRGNGWKTLRLPLTGSPFTGLAASGSAE